jgi:hypothetical protein
MIPGYLKERDQLICQSAVSFWETVPVYKTFISLLQTKGL